MKHEARGSGVEKRSVSGSPELFAKADQRMTERSITNFSEYVRDLIRRDLEREAMAEQQRGAQPDDHKQAA